MRNLIIVLLTILLFASFASAQVQVWLPDTTASPASTIMIPLYTSFIDTSMAVLAYQTEIVYDEAVARFDTFDIMETLTPENWTDTYNLDTTGIVIGGSWFYEPPYLQGEGALVYLEFEIPENASGTTALSFTEFYYNESHIQAFDGSIHISTIQVPSQYSTIQAGISAAVDGDTVLVADGIYTGDGNKNINFEGKDIVVMSENGPDNCVIDCENSGNGFSFGTENTNSVLSGFKIINGNTGGNGGGISLSNYKPIIESCKIYNCSAFRGGGIYCPSSAGGTGAVILECTIEDNSASNNGGGIYCRGDNDLTISNCTIKGNRAGGYGGGVYFEYFGGYVVFSNFLVTDNSSDMYGGGISCYDGAPIITNCTIVGNQSDVGGGD